eukprot:5506429-Amphidinium_carterae.1
MTLQNPCGYFSVPSTHHLTCFHAVHNLPSTVENDINQHHHHVKSLERGFLENKYITRGPGNSLNNYSGICLRSRVYVFPVLHL